LALRVLLIAKGDGAELEQFATVGAHRLDVALVAAGGSLDAELARTTDEHCAAGHRHAGNARDEGTGLGIPEVHGGGFGSGAWII